MTVEVDELTLQRIAQQQLAALQQTLDLLEQARDERVRGERPPLRENPIPGGRPRLRVIQGGR